MTMRRMIAMALGALLPVLAIALVMGNQWVADEINESDLERGEGLAPLVTWLQVPMWRISGPGSRTEWKYIFAIDFTLLVMLGLLAALVVVGARSVDPRRGAFGAFITGWWAAVLAAGLSGIVEGVLLNWAFPFPGGASRTIWISISTGLGFGFAYGWLVGLGTLAGYAVGRSRTPAAQQPYGQPQPFGGGTGPQPMPFGGSTGPQPMPYAPQQPYGRPAGYPPVQPGPQMGTGPQHPAAVPYTPPPGTPQPPAWGAAPAPGQPPAQPPAQPGPPAQDESDGDAGPPREAPPRDEPKDGPQEPPEDGPQDPPRDPSGDTGPRLPPPS
ncbi:hypothetical protein [Spirillospora albida]|uniref:hypothetical protein n=1 Tax=Spirillospora albida TaxID=58123 RepID=UPI0004C2AEB1|nr:hypothetical protein [Spirillospora albida]